MMRGGGGVVRISGNGVWRAGAAFFALFGLTPLFAAAADGSAGVSADEAALVQRGAYLARLGDCVACHTAPGGAPLAGGLAMHTPFGVLYSTNITPDKETGIGNYTFAQFDRAVREGVDDDGDNLYPAMPYPSFAKTTPADMRALYAYFVHGVKPVHRPNETNHLEWPFSMRIGMKFWNMAFLDANPYQADSGKSAEWNRGAYIVQGLGHCGTCHTPRGVGFQEKAMDQSGAAGGDYLGGASIDNWYAPSLRDLGTPQDIARFLQTGRNPHTAAYGPMTEVVHHSSQHFTDADLGAVADYLASLSSAPAGAPSAPSPTEAEHRLYGTAGGLGYVQFCSVCHQLDGNGAGDIFPPLAANSSVVSTDPASVIHVMLSGWKSAQTQRFPRQFAMPSFAALSDAELAQIVNFVRTSWGNRAPSVTADDVGKLRGSIDLAAVKPSTFVMPRFAAMLGRPDSAQLIYGMRLMLDTKNLLPHNVDAALTCASCHLDNGTAAHASPLVGLSAVFPAYSPRAGKVIDFKARINGCMLRSMNGAALDRDSREMNAMVAFVDWMKGDAVRGKPIPGRGTTKISHALVPDPVNGKRVYHEQCAACHGDNGEGMRRADGSYVFPPLWGDHSYNIGAGMARTYKAAGFIRVNMPVGNTLDFPLGRGGLTDQEAVDVAQYFTHMPRPDFAGKIHDWPNRKHPGDARY